MKLASYLKTEKVKQVDFAGKIGVARETVNRWARGSLTPSSVQLKAIYVETGGKVTANDFMDMASMSDLPSKTAVIEAVGKEFIENHTTERKTK